MQKNSCPDTQQLTAYNEGRVDDDALQQITDHLAVCDRCLDRLENLPAGRLETGIRDAVRSAEISTENEESPHLFAEAAVSPIDWAQFNTAQRTTLGFDRYELLATIGSSRFATVFLATQNNEQPIAIKIPSEELLFSSNQQQIFLGDAMRGFSLHHEHILPVLDFGHWQTNVPFSASRFLDIPNLKTFAKSKQSVTAKQLRLLFRQICLALQYAHEQLVLHRHLHPNNIFFQPHGDDTQVQIADFGQHHDGRYHFDLLEPLQEPNPFESPEAIHNDPKFIDIRTDIFSLGKVLKLLLILTTELTPEEVEAWQQIHQTCTQIRRRDRYQTIKQVMEMIPATG